MGGRHFPRILFIFALTGWFGLGAGSQPAALAAPVGTKITILHTNDIHSHLRPSRGQLRLGGLARMKTAIDRVRRASPHTLLLDGGDWAEGSIYYTEGLGAETLKLMGQLGYDAAAVGNHDFLNGPDVLLDSIKRANPRFPLLAANTDTSGYSRADEFAELILPYVIRQVGDLKIAIIGLTTYELIYDHFLEPVKIKDPVTVSQALVTLLKPQTDAIIAISHNSVEANKALLRLVPGIDLIIGAHDHKKLVQPAVVEYLTKTSAWVVEAGEAGEYLGRVDLTLAPRGKYLLRKSNIKLERARLLQIDAALPEDPAIAESIHSLEGRMNGRYGSLFGEKLGESKIELTSGGVESPMGNFVTDAYLKYSGADLALENSKMVYGTIHEGPQTAADIFNANPGVYNPATGKAWTLKILPLKGRLLRNLLNVFYSWKKIIEAATLSAAGLELTFSPLFMNVSVQSDLQSFGITDPLSTTGLVIGDLNIRGEPLDPSRTYKVALGGGMIEAFRFLNKLLPGSVDFDNMKETHQEDWRIIADYLRANAPLQASSIPMGRVRTLEPDLGIQYSDVTWKPSRKTKAGMAGRISVRIHNAGASASSDEVSIKLFANKNSTNYALDPDLIQVGSTQQLPSLLPGASKVLVWENIELIGNRNVYPVTAKIISSEDEINSANNEITRFLSGNR